MWELDYEESWVPKNWCFWTVVLGKTLESPLDCKEIQPVHPKDQSWVFIGRTDAEAETLYFGHLMRRVDSLEKTLMLGGIGGRRRRGDRGWDGWTASLTRWAWVWVNSGSWWWTGRPGVLRFMGHKESDTTERLKWTELTVLPWSALPLFFSLQTCSIKPTVTLIWVHHQLCFLFPLFHYSHIQPHVLLIPSSSIHVNIYKSFYRIWSEMEWLA